MTVQVNAAKIEGHLANALLTLQKISFLVSLKDRLLHNTPSYLCHFSQSFVRI